MEEAETALAKIQIEISRVERARVAALSQDGQRQARQRQADKESRARAERASHRALVEITAAVQTTIETLSAKAIAFDAALTDYDQYALYPSQLGTLRNLFKPILHHHLKAMGLHSGLLMWKDEELDLNKLLPERRKDGSNGKQ